MTESPAYTPPIATLLQSPPRMPLDAGRPNEAKRAELDVATDKLFGDRAIGDNEMAAACHAALWLRHNFLPESHRLSQKIGSVEGSYWHGLMHRREGDFGNSKYWFRRVGDHRVFAHVAAALPDLIDDSTPARARSLADGEWDPAAFIDLCEAAVRGDPDLRTFCAAIQQKEWELLFDHCFDGALS